MRKVILIYCKCATALCAFFLVLLGIQLKWDIHKIEMAAMEPLEPLTVIPLSHITSEEQILTPKPSWGAQTPKAAHDARKSLLVQRLSYILIIAFLLLVHIGIHRRVKLLSSYPTETKTNTPL